MDNIKWKMLNWQDTLLFCPRLLLFSTLNSIHMELFFIGLNRCSWMLSGLPTSAILSHRCYSVWRLFLRGILSKEEDEVNANGSPLIVIRVRQIFRWLRNQDDGTLPTPTKLLFIFQGHAQRFGWKNVRSRFDWLRHVIHWPRHVIHWFHWPRRMEIPWL